MFYKFESLFINLGIGQISLYVFSVSILGDIIEFNKVYDINKLHPVQKQYIGTIIVLEIANIEYKLNKSK